MSTPQDLNPTELIFRLQKLEGQVAAIGGEVNDTSTVVQGVLETQKAQVIYGNQNYLRNGNFDLDRNRYLYDVDYGGGTVPADVSQECAHWYSHPADTAKESTGNIASGDATLVINDPLFDAGDNGVEIVVEGAGAAGADLVTTVSGAPASTTTATLAAAASTTATGARVRWRLLQRKEDSTDVDADANQATCTAIKTTSHSRYASTVSDPNYDKVNGFLHYGDASHTIDAPLPHNYFTASKQYVVSFIYKLNAAIDADETYPAQFYMGFWDNTAGRRGWLEGQRPGLTVTTQGVPGSTTRKYMVLMYTPWGGTIATETVTVTDSAATLNADHYETLAWSQPMGVVRSEIYRFTDGVYEKLLFPYPETTYYDRGQTSATVSGWPTPTLTRPRAYLETTTQNLAPARTDKWELAQFNVTVPSDYAVPANADKQWFVLGLQDSVIGGGADHSILIDLVCVDDKYGIFTRSPLDFLAKRQLSITPTSGDQGTAGTGGGPPIEPGDGCVVFEDSIETDHGDIAAIDLVDNEHKYRVIDRNNEAVEYTAKIIDPQPVFTVVTAHGKLSGSGTHPCFQHEGDVLGTRLKVLDTGDSLLSKHGPVPILQKIAHARLRHTVHISLKGPEKGFWQNSFGVHNVKEFLLT